MLTPPSLWAVKLTTNLVKLPSNSHHLVEIVSAFGTVGVSRGITANLSSLSKIILIILMYLGRVGAATLGVSILDTHRKKHTRYSEGKIIVG